MEAARLEADLVTAENTLQAAQQLLGQLSGENERWRQQVQILEKELSLVPARALISSAYLVYLGGANETVREIQLREWLSGFKLQDYSFKNFLSSEQEMLTWKKEGLPADTLSMENAIMIMNTLRTPLIIDPATQASEWLKNSLKKSNDNVEVLNNQDSKFNTNLELSIRFGKILIIQEVDGIESMLIPILRKDLI
jgi:dynein heavy chain 2